MDEDALFFALNNDGGAARAPAASGSLQPDLAEFVAMVRQAALAPLADLTPGAARDRFAARLQDSSVSPALAVVIDHIIDADDRRVPVREYVPHSCTEDAIVYFHSGGWVFGSVEVADVAARFLADATGARLYSVDYSLAPEHPFPAAAEEAVAAFLWVAGRTSSNGKIAVAGDSSGGNLAAVAALRARDMGNRRIAAQLLVYPVTDYAPSPHGNPSIGDVMLSPADVEWFWGHYVPDPAEREHPRASILREDDLSGLPPTFVATAEFDPLRNQGEAFAAKLGEAGVTVTAQRYLGTVHGFFSAPNRFRSAQTLLAEMAAFLRRCGFATSPLVANRSA